MNEDISSGLKNAMEHGDSLEQAVRSFINAGYDQEDVKEVAASITKSTSAPSQASQPASQSASPPTQLIIPSQPNAPQQVNQQEKPKQAGKTMIIAIIVTLVLVLAGIGFLLYNYLSS